LRILHISVVFAMATCISPDSIDVKHGIRTRVGRITCS
jgi:hypothetical protein